MGGYWDDLHKPKYEDIHCERLSYTPDTIRILMEKYRDGF
jgi:hypothetical protein